MSSKKTTPANTKPVAKPVAKQVAKPSSAQTKPTQAQAQAQVVSARPASVSKVDSMSKPIEGDLKTIIETVTKTPKPAELVNRCAFVIDEQSRAATFFRHRDAVYLNMLEKHDADPERIRKGIIGAIRFGKQFVVGKKFFQDLALL